MADHKPDWVKAAEIVRDAGGRIIGRTKLQKVAYLLELSGLGDGFQFEYRHYGPYSEDLAGAIQIADAFGLVREDERQAEWGGKYSIYTATERAGNRLQGARVSFAEAAAQIGPVELELAATAAYLSAVEGSANPWEETTQLKPEKADETRINAAKRAYRRLIQMSAPKNLPDI
jgi:uncharacterized protein